MAAIADDKIEIMLPKGSERAQTRYRPVCLCCARTGQPMDDDGCGICDACLALPFRATEDADDLETFDPPPHLSLTTHR